jgi:glycosyltransferase involved in cell wall biosynthesis
MRVAIYHPWIYLKSGLERTILEIVRRSRHQWTIYTSHYDREGTYPELQEMEIIEVGRVPVRRDYGAVLVAALCIARTRLDAARHEALVICCEGLGDLLILRNADKPVLCLCFTPLRAAFDDEYRTRLLSRSGVLRPVALALELGFRVVDRFCWRRYSRVIAISDTVRRRISAGGLRSADAIEVLHPGVDPARIRPSDRFEPFFVIAGRIMWTKNIEIGLEAFALAREALGSDFRLVIAGMVDAKSQDYIARLAARARQIGRVEFLIGPTDEEMHRLYRDCTAVLFTPFNEDWGIVPLEAMAAGKPVIAVDRGGPRESVIHGETGFLEPEEPAAFARRMIEIGKNRDLARRLGRTGAERVRGLTWDAFVSRLDDAIEEMVAPGGGRR